ncbi:MAG: VWA domain-containing protein [Myxococcales bacterium]|nr:VWA domain-containing protein [Myxococcales bacterium]
MKKGTTEIAIVLDCSGSMDAIRDDAVGAFNAFLREQQGQPGDARLTLVLFHHSVRVAARGVDLRRARPLDRASFVPNGGTALLDAVGWTVDDLATRILDLPEEERPERVVVAILTDGRENSSRHYTRDAIFSRIRLRTEVDGWTFVYLGADQDAFDEARSIGIPDERSSVYAATGAGTYAGMSRISRVVSDVRSSGSVSLDWDGRPHDRKRNLH